MQAIKKYIPFFSSALLMWVALYIIYPHYQYYIDPDGTAYLTISKRYASGDYHRAINGYWSPWSCWLTALLIKTGIAAIPASVIINSIGAAGFLFISQSFFLKFGIERKMQWLFNVTLAFFLCYAVFWQSFDDLWECFFLLGTLHIMLSEGFSAKPGLWIGSGFIGTLAYFAKAYSFPFFILNTICCCYLIDKKQWLKISATAIGAMVLCSLPWIWLLHKKYGIWTTSTAGTLNTSWYLVGHPHWKEGIDLLLPPPYPDSPSYWEDPWFVNGATPHFWNSWHLFGLQLLRIGLNIWKFIVSSFQLSVFFIVIVGYAKWNVIWKRGAPIAKEQRVLMLSFLLFTIGYILVNFESRYLWYMVPLSMVMGVSMLENIFKEKLSSILLVAFSLSFVVYPVWTMRKIFNEGAKEFETAEQIKAQKINGSFTCSAYPGVSMQRVERLAYFSGMQLYCLPDNFATEENLLRDMNRYHVNYMFYSGVSPHEHILLDELWQSYPDVTYGHIEGTKIFKINP